MTRTVSKLIGARVTRLEDRALLSGSARFVDDIASPGVLHAAFARSPHPHALIRSIDLSAARAVLGVAASFQEARDLLPDGAHERLYAVHGVRLSQAARAAILQQGFPAWG